MNTKKILLALGIGLIMVYFNLGNLAYAFEKTTTVIYGKIYEKASNYIEKSGGTYKSKGRVIVFSRKSPEFTVVFFNNKGREVKRVSSTAGKGGIQYTLAWLSQGYYKIKVGTTGYINLTMKKKIVKTGNDIQIELTFDKKGGTAEKTESETDGTITASKEVYKIKRGEAYDEKGSLHGDSSDDAPFFTVYAFDQSGNVVKKANSKKLRDGSRRGYELFLEQGTYDFKVVSQEYKTLELKDKKIKKGQALRIDLTFSD